MTPEAIEAGILLVIGSIFIIGGIVLLIIGVKLF